MPIGLTKANIPVILGQICLLEIVESIRTHRWGGAKFFNVVREWRNWKIYYL